MANKRMVFVMLVGHAEQFEAHLSQFFANFGYELFRCLYILRSSNSRGDNDRQYVPIIITLALVHAQRIVTKLRILKLT